MRGIGFDELVDPQHQSRAMSQVHGLQVSSEKTFYRNMLTRFSHVLSQFKYALRTINKPKVVFLISEGPARGAFKSNPSSLVPEKTPYDDYYYQDNPFFGVRKSEMFDSIFMHDDATVAEQNKVFEAFLFNYLKSIIRSINAGGSVLYTINPRRLSDTYEDDTSGDESLIYLASQSGGKYFTGNDPRVIVDQVKKTTAAYYEIIYAAKPEMGRNMRIQIKHQRPGVRIHTLNYAEREKPYLLMDDTQKKIFALNVVKGGAWSRMVGKVVKVGFKRKERQKKGDRRIYTIQVPIPVKMRQKKLDIFLLRVHPKTHQVNIGFQQVTGQASGELRLAGNKSENLYFTVIEPKETLCIYNKVQ
jgi:hypothetical protein